MFLLVNVASQTLILGLVPESLGVLIFGVALVLLAFGLRWLMKRGETNVQGEVEKSK
jgi:hypothetical protein